jgi:FlaA1/EpsC-like NDP-sugar epimerase
MHGLWAELGHIRPWSLLIESAAGFVIAGYAAAGFGYLVFRLDRSRARHLVAEGALAALSLMVCATLLKTLMLTSWRQIGLFASVLAIRTALKRIFLAEERQTGRPEI